MIEKSGWLDQMVGKNRNTEGPSGEGSEGREEHHREGSYYLR